MQSKKGKRTDVRKKVTERAFGPAADEFGKEIAPLGKELGAITNKVGVMLVQGVRNAVYGYETVGEWLRDAVAKRLMEVPQEKIVPPDPRIAVPATQALVYSMGEEYIREMFANLLATDMNADTKSQIHPAFTEIIKEMTPTDAKLIKLLHGNPQIEYRIVFGSKQLFLEAGVKYSFYLPDSLDFVECPRSLSNLERLGLLEFRRTEFPVGDEFDNKEKLILDEYSALRNSLETMSQELREKIGLKEGKEVYTRKSGVYITPLGSSFVNVCLKA